MPTVDDSTFDRRTLLQSAGVGITMVVAGCGGSTDDEPEGTDTTDGSDGSDGSDSTETTDSGGQGMGEKVPAVHLVTRNAEAHPHNFESSRLMMESWQELGIDFEFEAVAHSELIDTYFLGQGLEIMAGGWGGGMDRLDPMFHTYETFHSSQTDEGSFNLVNYVNPEFDELAERQAIALDREERQEAVYGCQELIASDQPVTPLMTDALVEPINVDTVTNLNPTIGLGIVGYSNMIEAETTHGAFRWGGRGNVTTLNPLNVPSSTDRHMNDLLHDRLFQFDADGTLRPSIAESMDTVDETTVRVNLREETMRFHDGEELTAEDVQFSYEYALEVGAVPAATYIDSLESIDIVDDRTVQFNLSEPFAPFTTNGVAFPYVIPKHVWEDVPESVDAETALEWPNPEPVGSGPFEFVEWRPEEEMTVQRFEGHHNEPNVERVTKVMGPSQAMLRSLEDGTLDAVWGSGLSKTAIEGLAERASHVELRESPTHGIFQFSYHCEKEPLDDVAFRRALGKAVPKSDIFDIVSRSYGEILDTPIAPANEFWHNPDVEQFGDDLDAARQELEDAGYTWDDAGKLHYPA